MIQNLNQFAFQEFGSVVSERSQAAQHVSKNAAPSLQLVPGDVTVYCATADTWVNCGTGSIVLSVSTDEKIFIISTWISLPASVRVSALR